MLMKSIIKGSIMLSLLGSGVLPIAANADGGTKTAATLNQITLNNNNVVTNIVDSQPQNSNRFNAPNTDAYQIAQAQQAKAFAKSQSALASKQARALLLQAGVNRDVLQKAIEGDSGAIAQIRYEVQHAKGFKTNKAKQNGLWAFNTLSYNYRKAHKSGVWVTPATRSDVNVETNIGNDVKATAVLSATNSYRVAKMVQTKRTTWYQLENGLLVKANKMKVSNALTNAKDLKTLTQNIELRYKVANSKYYTHAKRGVHVALVKKTLVQHATKSFHDSSSNVKKNVLRKGKHIRFNKVVKVGNKYRLHLTNGKYVTASKEYVKVK